MCNKQQLITEYMSLCDVHGNQADVLVPVLFLDYTYTLLYNKYCKIFQKKIEGYSVVNFEEMFNSYRTSARENTRAKHDAK